MKIKLEDYVRATDELYVGRETGDFVRQETDLDRVAMKHETISIEIPKVNFIANTFWEGLFFNTIPNFGTKKFLEKFEFYEHDESIYSVKDNLAEVIELVWMANGLIPLQPSANKIHQDGLIKTFRMNLNNENSTNVQKPNGPDFS